ncbi:MAG: hypothetical protein KIS66_14805 [Fimbriimonadaceae bacterium]|nr:hypothetical protein [Fimbriimonadaceae bacterium]
MRRNPVLVATVAALLVSAVASFGQPAAKVEDNPLIKIRKVELLNQILPVVMTKEQLDAILPAVERARAKVREVEKKEATELRAIEARMDTAIKAALEEGQVPKLEFVDRLRQLMWAMGLRRQTVVGENTESVLASLKKELNAGQLKAAANALSPKQIDPGVRVEELTQDDRLRMYVRFILLDPYTYDLLVALARKK